MEIKEAIRLLDPATTSEALAEIEYYAGFSGKQAAIHAISDACEVACEAMKKRTLLPPKIEPDKLSPNLIEHYYCPSCGKYFGQRGKRDCILFDKETYCQGKDCGQALDWSDTE